MPQNQFNGDDSLIVRRGATEVSKKTSGSFAFSLSKDARFALTYTDTGAWQAQVQLPSWLSRSMYELMSRPSIAGWTYSYRVYNIVPNESEIMMRIKAGDVIGVQELFSSRRASPFDRSIRNESLLRVCLTKPNEKKMIEANIDVQYSLLGSCISPTIRDMPTIA